MESKRKKITEIYQMEFLDVRWSLWPLKGVFLLFGVSCVI